MNQTTQFLEIINDEITCVFFSKMFLRAIYNWNVDAFQTHIIFLRQAGLQAAECGNISCEPHSFPPFSQHFIRWVAGMQERLAIQPETNYCFATVCFLVWGKACKLKAHK